MSEHRPSVGAGYQNWKESDAGFFEKLRLVSRNSWRKMKLRQDCCDHPGEPGC